MQNRQDLSLFRLSHSNEIKLYKNKEKQIAKTQIIEAIKIVSFIWILFLLFRLKSILIQQKLYWMIDNFTRFLIENHWDLLLREYAKKTAFYKRTKKLKKIENE